MAKKTPKWGSPQMQRAIRRHDRKFARQHGGPKPTGGACALVLLVLVGVPAVLVVAALRGWA